ncbi:MAG: hypothetical protein Q8Q08_06860 [Candidatus Omnitrophota bacterium]|nr:hypothetical protein [Candidatus Omnitrophota bacterium]MDZ4242849.1 hypothetical protein [Candidatus Omnitrophota bacterium]
MPQPSLKLFYPTILALISTFLLPTPGHTQAPAPRDCQKAVSSAHLSRIRQPGNIIVEDFALSADDQRIVVRMLHHAEMLYEGVNQRYGLTDFFPGHSERRLSMEQGQKKAEQWREEAKKEEGLEIQDYGKCIYAYRRAFYLYDIGRREWTKLGWKEGKRLMKEFPYIALDFNETSPETVASPDGTMVLRKEVLKQKIVRFFTLEGSAVAYRFFPECAGGGKGRVFNMKYDEFHKWKVQWASDSSFALVLNAGSSGGRKNKFYLLRF